MQGTFIVLEGPDGSGTTTHSRLLAETLEREGHDVVLTAEPSDGPIGKWIRELLKTGKMSPMALQLLFCADRAWHVDTVIRPALESGKTVISDRYWHSTIVYAQAQGLDISGLREINDRFPQPDLTIVALPPLAVCLERMGSRSEKDVFEREDLQRKIHASYKTLSDGQPGTVIVDTTGDKMVTAGQIALLVRKKL
jgi:dTMP kinase